MSFFINENKHVLYLKNFSARGGLCGPGSPHGCSSILHKSSSFTSTGLSLYSSEKSGKTHSLPYDPSEIAGTGEGEARACAWMPRAKEQWCTAGMCSISQPCSIVNLASGKVYCSCDPGLVWRSWGSSEQQGQKCGSSALIWVIFSPLPKMMENFVFLDRRKGDCLGLLRPGERPQGLGRE